MTHDRLHMKVTHDMTRNAKMIEFPCVLKTIISHAHRDNKTFTLNDKQIRSRLRAKFVDTHIKNTSWICNNQREYDNIRRAFDAHYDAQLSNARKSRKRNAKSNDDVVNNDVVNVE